MKNKLEDSEAVWIAWILELNDRENIYKKTEKRD